jgi:hypothetical protein
MGLRDFRALLHMTPMPHTAPRPYTAEALTAVARKVQRQVNPGRRHEGPYA